MGRRADSDFDGFGIDHAAGYALVNVGGWHAINSHVTAYANLDNALNQHYNEVVGYPALDGKFSGGISIQDWRRKVRTAALICQLSAINGCS